MLERELIQSGSTTLEKYCQGIYGGLDCASFVGWSIHNAGFKAKNTASSYGGSGYLSKCSKWKYENGKTICEVTTVDNIKKLCNEANIGDLIYHEEHVMLIIGKFDGGIYVYEGTNPIGMGKYTYEQLKNSGYYAIRKMGSYYSNSSNYACKSFLNKNGSIEKITIPALWQDESSLFKERCSKD